MMCRLFGFRSVVSSQVHSSLLSAENALVLQSHEHPDGWGVAYYAAGVPHVVKSTSTAIHDSLFKRVSGVVSSETVLAHIRKATVGDHSIINCHPFQFGSWVFVHNGNIRDFKRLRSRLLNKVSPDLTRFILGDTDSEVLFYLVLTHLSRIRSLRSFDFTLSEVANAAKQTVLDVCQLAGDYSTDANGDPTETYLTFLITNGEVIVGHQGGKELYFSNYKKRCSERDSCPHFSPECERETQSGFVSHMIYSSEPLSGENVWIQAHPGTMVGVDKGMKLALIEP